MRTTLLERGDRRPRAPVRARAERLLRLAEHLPDGDRLLVELRYRDGQSIGVLAGLAGVSRTAMYERLARIRRRMASPEYRWAVVHARDLPPQTAEIARRVFLGGVPIRQAALALDLELRRVSVLVAALRELAYLESRTSKEEHR